MGANVPDGVISQLTRYFPTHGVRETYVLYLLLRNCVR